jgi:hypothetical protein
MIATWIAVCVDIIEKVKELSATGDGTAKVIEEKLNKISPSGLSTSTSISSLSRNKHFSKITVKLRTLLSLTLPKLLSEERIIKAPPITGRCIRR